ncbi:hypothetical protein CEXT_154221 [Caerostris extrusa]|uniref:Uncharacterized protein n=1 Tax=Caerostris extrusa TaxID=172846 RepID=A0AAV4X8C8_CAEEX|nr:hypothetical protein CEXT_154221 [Caerostris extrusa]
MVSPTGKHFVTISSAFTRSQSGKPEARRPASAMPTDPSQAFPISRTEVPSPPDASLPISGLQGRIFFRCVRPNLAPLCHKTTTNQSPIPGAAHSELFANDGPQVVREGQSVVFKLPLIGAVQCPDCLDSFTGKEWFLIKGIHHQTS